MLCSTLSFFSINNPYLVLFSIFHSVVTRCFVFSFENHRFRSAAALPNLHSELSCCLLLYHFVLSVMFLRLAFEASVPERRTKSRPNYERLFFDFVFRETNSSGAKARRGRPRGGNETFPTRPTPTPIFALCCRIVFFFFFSFFFFFFFCQNLKTRSFFAPYSLEMLSTLSLTVICLLLVFEGYSSKPLYQSWLTTPFDKIREVLLNNSVSTEAPISK